MYIQLEEQEAEGRKQLYALWITRSCSIRHEDGKEGEKLISWLKHNI
jgi:hypothetical protein